MAEMGEIVGSAFNNGGKSRNLVSLWSAGDFRDGSRLSAPKTQRCLKRLLLKNDRKTQYLLRTLFLPQKKKQRVKTQVLKCFSF